MTTYEQVAPRDDALLDTIYASLETAYGGIHATDSVICVTSVVPHPSRSELAQMAADKIVLWGTDWEQLFSLRPSGKMGSMWGPVLVGTAWSDSWAALVSKINSLTPGLWITVDVEYMRFWFAHNNNEVFDLSALDGVEGTRTMRFFPDHVTVEP